MINAFRWNEWNRNHIANHGVFPDEAEYIVDHAQTPYPEPVGQGKWRVRSQTSTGRYLQVVFVFDPDDTVFVLHSRDLTEREKKQLRKRRR